MSIISFQYFDMFCLLEKGHYLIKFGQDDHDPHFWLDGHMASNILGPKFISNGWVRRVITEDEGARTFYSLSVEGRQVFDEGKQWYYSLPLWYRFLGRLGIY